MELDMHYYGLGFIARAAGFSKDDANTIAYASQYVDDSTESVAIRVGGGSFDTVRTAHLGPEAWTDNVQKNVYVPFHFLPPKPIKKFADSYVTAPGTSFAGLVLDRASSETVTADRLIAMGIAMHTFADTFSHQGFTGREDGENQVTKLQTQEGDGWEDAGIPPIVGSLATGVGHMLAGSFPDQPWRTWRLKTKAVPRYFIRNNPRIFEQALKSMYNRLSGLPGADGESVPWDSFSASVRAIIAIESDDLVPRVKAWLELYGDTFRDQRGYRNIQGYRYDRLKWRQQAVEPVGNFTVEWDGMSREELRRQIYKPLPGFYGSDWVRFHNMALKQRHFVLENLL